MTFYNRGGILYYRLNGKRVSSRMLDTPSNRKLLLSYHKNDDFLNKFNLNRNVPTLIALCEYVLNEKEKYVKNTTYATYLSLFESRLKPFFKSQKVNEVARKDILKFYSTFSDKSTLNVCSTLLKGAFEKAIIEEYINFIPLVKKPTIKNDYEIKPFSMMEIQRILNNCNEDYTLRNILGLGFYSGMRIGEIFGLTWSDINFNSYTISINRTVTQGFLQTPKTKSSIRTIDMLPQAETYLLDQRKRVGLSNFVFLGQRGKRFNRSVDLYNRWKNLLKTLNIEYRSIYQTRHSFASNMLSNQEDLNWVSFMLGHKSPFITLQKYTRYINVVKSERKKTFLDDDTKTSHYG
uniref:site-specific integrase n=1 Tax=Aliarcobacter sp. TaxID=2321116 RepID=UPI00404710CA